QLKQDLEIVKLQFALALNTTTDFVPKEENIKLPLQLGLPSEDFSQHPSIKIIVQQQKTALLDQKLERARFLPDINVGYSNMSMRGIGADNVNYNSSTRFQSVQVALGIPIFFGSQKGKLNAARINQSISKNLYQLEMNQLKIQYQSLLNKLQSNTETV